MPIERASPPSKRGRDNLRRLACRDGGHDWRGALPAWESDVVAAEPEWVRSARSPPQASGRNREPAPHHEPSLKPK
jgi:hypothetical protein